MARGPLPNPEKRRRNAPTIPTTALPASGFDGDVPECPYALAGRGRSWWDWAWGSPQAAAWDAGALYVVARRASLEDDLRVLEDVGELSEALGLGEHEAARELEAAFGRLKALASGRTAVMREMRELDNRLGLNPKAMADLRWSITGEPEEQGARKPGSGKGKRAHLTAVA